VGRTAGYKYSLYEGQDIGEARRSISITRRLSNSTARLKR
jgi:hypothetical protein